MDRSRRWEQVAAGLERIAVEGGWLYRSFYTAYTAERPSSRVVTTPVFVPDAASRAEGR